MKKIAVFGGCGFVGTNICLLARKRGWEVIAFDNLIRKDTEENIPHLTKSGVNLIRGDIRNYVDFDRLPKDLDGIFNLAANPGIPWSLEYPAYDFQTNAMGALNVLEYSRNNGNIPVIFASTNKVYSEEINEYPLIEGEERYDLKAEPSYKTKGISSEGIAETFPMDSVGRYPHSPYGVSKSAADLLHQEYFHAFKVPTVINRMSCIYGEYQKGVADQGWASHFVRTLVQGDGKVDIFGDGKQVRDMLWGGDVAELYLKELEQIREVAGEVFNVGGGVKNTLSLIEALSLIEGIYGKQFETKFHDWRHADQKVYISDITKVTSNKALNWSPKITPKEGFIKLIEEAVSYGK
jgi:CDP-paratose 2-epimerase